MFMTVANLITSLEEIMSHIEGILKTKESHFKGKYVKKAFIKDVKPLIEEDIVYAERDGNPMSDNTKQFNWIVKIKEGLEIMFTNREDVFIAGDLLWYPVEGDNKTRIAPDAMVAFGRPKGDRGSYRQWEEGGVAPQVVFEVLSPCNTKKGMKEKLEFYETYGVEEYYEYDPDRIIFKGWIREGDILKAIDVNKGWRSPMLKINFEIINGELVIIGMDGSKFLTSVEREKKSKKERMEKEEQRQRADQERQRADQAEQHVRQERQRADHAVQRAEMLAAKLRALGVDIEN